MDDSRHKTTGRKILIGALIALFVAALGGSAGAVILTVGLDSFPGAEETPTQEASQRNRDSQQAPESTQEATAATQQGSEDAPLEIAQEIQLVDIIPSPRIITLNGAGGSQRLTVQGFYSDGSIGELEADSGAAFSYTSSDSEVVQVSSDGVVSSIKAGGADITVTYGDFDSTVPVLVWGEVRRIPPIDPERLLPIDDDGTAIVLNRVMARLEPGYSVEDAAEVAASIGGEVVFEFRTFPGYVIDFDARTEEDLEAALAVLQADERVTHAYPDMLITASGGGPVDIETLLLPVGQGEAYLYAGMEEAWNLMNSTPSLKPVVIAVVDGGFAINSTDYNIEDVLRAEFGSIINIPEKQLAKDDDKLSVAVGNKYVIDLDTDDKNVSHGTAVTSVIVAANNNPPISNSFSGVVSSVNGLAYALVFLGVGHAPWYEETLLVEDFVGDKEKENIHEGHTIRALEIINRLEFVQEYKD